MSQRTIRVAVDAMGGDNYPQALVEGAIDALAQYPDITIALVGKDDLVTGSIQSIESGHGSQKGMAKKLAQIRDRLSVVHADELIEMSDSPAQAIRKKKKASIVVANQLCKAGDADAVISAGNTGAAMASSLLYMGRLTGVSRPAITALLPSKRGRVAVLDLGANTDCKPEHLYQFAVMGSIYVSHILNIEKPRVGLLNIGEERSKGNELTEGAYALLDQSDLNFIGNVEGRDIFEGVADVIVCDGFVGNVLLKFGESMFGFVTHMLKRSLSKNVWRMAGGYMMKPAFKDMKKDMVVDEYGGAQLLGVDGISIICHGNSSPTAIANAIRVARQLVQEEVNEQIKHQFEKKRKNS